MVEYDSHIASEIKKHEDEVVIDIDILRELHEYVSIIATMYHEDNPFHNFQHGTLYSILCIQSVIMFILSNMVFLSMSRDDVGKQAVKANCCTTIGFTRICRQSKP